MIRHLWPCIGLLLAAPAAAAPSFDCAKARGWVEHTVCAETAISDLDRRIAELYAARLRSGDEAAVREAQRSWARGRGACEKQADATACLTRSYRQRLAELGGADLPAWAGGIPGALGAVDACLAATPSIAVAVTGLQPDGDMVRLALRGGNGRGFACTAPRDGLGMVALHDAEAGPDGPGFRRGAAAPCPDATPVSGSDGRTIGWIAAAAC